MYLGKVMEIGDSDTIYGEPKHPYTKALLDAVYQFPIQKRAWKRKNYFKGGVTFSIKPT